MTDDQREFEFGVVNLQACPHFIMVPEHYRTDGTCFCNESNDPNMEEWGYVWNPDIERWDVPDENEEEEESSLPDSIACYVCERTTGKPVERKVVRLGPIIDAHRDPTQTYVLQCGHTVICP